jgi:Uma2 family endonuclease
LPLLFAESDYLVPDLVVLPLQQQSAWAVHLVVEVLSQFTASRDRGVKRDGYARFGVPEYWIIDPTAQHVEVYRLQEDADRLQIVTDRLAWQPVKGGPTLELNVRELLSNLD